MVVACPWPWEGNDTELLRAWVSTGARSGEIRGVQRQEFDPLTGTIGIKRTYTRKRFGPPKKGGARKVSLLHPIPEATREWRPGLSPESRLVLARIAKLKITGIAPESYLFGGAVPLSPSHVAKLWAKTLTAAGVTFRNPEQLRHTFASHLLSRGAPERYVMACGGWKSSTVLQRTYARWMPEVLLADAPPAHPDLALVK
jgi:integrase